MPQPAAPPIARTDFPSLPIIARGKVRDIYRTGDVLLLVATDRVSAFDVVLPTPIPDKGRVLTELSAYWFRQLAGLVSHHLISIDVSDLPAAARPYADVLAGRTMVCRPAERIPVECVVRGYLTGSAWSEYRSAQTINGVAFPAGLQENARFEEPLFTPTTKADTGHDEKLSHAELVDLVGGDTAALLRDVTIRLYQKASELAATRGILIADSKLEFGWIDGTLTWIDEAFTPDSSRFWAREDYRLGGSIPSFDKQYLRDYLTASGWNREPPAPELPADVARTTSERYVAILQRLIGPDGTATA
jgi:phosphoribosylaminoimidazole-succinocarboxamide synthase